MEEEEESARGKEQGKEEGTKITKMGRRVEGKEIGEGMSVGNMVNHGQRLG